MNFIHENDCRGWDTITEELPPSRLMIKFLFFNIYLIILLFLKIVFLITEYTEMTILHHNTVLQKRHKLASVL